MRMKTISFTILSSVLSLVLPCTLHAQQRTLSPAEFVEWLPITDSDKQAKSPVVDKDAGAEVPLSRVHVSDEYLSGGGLQRVLYHYVRVKVFNAGAKEKVGTIDLPYHEPGGIIDVAGRNMLSHPSSARLRSNLGWTFAEIRYISRSSHVSRRMSCLRRRRS